jgi:hypothetical protein
MFTKLIHNKKVHFSVPTELARGTKWSGNRRKYAKVKRVRKGGKGESTPEGGGE